MEQQTTQTAEQAVTAEAAIQTSETMTEVKRKKSIGEVLKNYFTATRMAYMAVFTALAYILYMPWFEFSLIPAVPFLKVDFSNAFVMIAGFSLGPVSGVVVGILKEILHALTFSQTIGVGELANILIMLPFILIPSIIYKRHKGIKTVLVSISIACVCQVIWSVPVNYVLTFPFYLNLYTHSSWADGMKYYLTVWYWAALFNLVKTILISVVVLLLYKPLSRLIKLTNEKFNKRKRSA